VLTPAERRRKLDNRSTKAQYVGYEPNCKAYRLLCDGKIIISRDVVFDETPRAVDTGSPALPLAPTSPTSHSGWGGTADESTDDDDAAETQPAAGDGGPADLPPPVVHSLGEALGRAADLPPAAQDMPPPPAHEPQDPTGSPSVTAPPVDGSAHRYPSRVRAAPQRLGEEGHATTAIGVKDELAWPWQVAADDGGTAWPRADNPVGAAIVAHAGSNPDKMTLAQAKKAHDWPAFDAATRQEVDSLWNNGSVWGTWRREVTGRMGKVGGKKTRASASVKTAKSTECEPTVSPEQVVRHQIDFRECALFFLSACCSVPLAVFWARFTAKASSQVRAFNGVQHVALPVFVLFRKTGTWALRPLLCHRRTRSYE